MSRLVLVVSFLITPWILAEDEVSANRSVLAAKAEESLIIDIEDTGRRLVAVGERGHVLLKDEDTWRQVVVPTQSLLTSVDFVSEEVGYAVGHQQAIIKTVDGGESWDLVYYEPDDLYYPALMDVWFRDPQWGISVGAYGLALITKNGGETWEPIDLANIEDFELGLPHFYALTFDGRNNRLYLAGEFGHLSVSKDYGQTWELLETPYTGSFFNIKISDSGALHAMGLRGHLFRSEDQGATWQEVETNTTASINGMLNLPGSQLLYLALDGVMLFSENDGKTVRVINNSDRASLLSGVLAELNELIVVGEQGIKTVTLDGQPK